MKIIKYQFLLFMVFSSCTTHRQNSGIIYYPDGKTPHFEKYFKNGKQDSIYREWDVKGRLVLEGYYENGKKNEKWTTFFPEIKNKKYLETDYKNGNIIRSYEYVSFGEDTTLKMMETFISYEIDTLTKKLSYHRNGVLASENYEKNGDIDGVDRTWNEHGVLIIECYSKKNKQEGWRKAWSDSGKLQNEQLYEDGILIYVKLYDEKGKVVKEIRYSKDENKFFYDDNRILK